MSDDLHINYAQYTDTLVKLIGSLICLQYWSEIVHESVRACACACACACMILCMCIGACVRLYVCVHAHMYVCRFVRLRPILYK